MEDELVENAERYQMLMQNSPDMILLQNPDGRTYFVSPHCYDILGYTPAEIMELNIFESIHPEDLEKVQVAFGKAMKGEELFEFQYRISAKNGMTVWVSHTASPIYIDEKLDSIQSNIRDITDQKKVEQELIANHQALLEAEQKNIETVRMLEQSAKLSSIGVIAAGITHEINQPLNAISITTDSILYWNKQNKNILPDTIITKLNRIADGTGRIEKIIKHLRSFWIDKAEESEAIVDINEAVRNSLSFTNRQMQANGINPIIELTENELMVKANSIQIEQILVNLITNSIQSLKKMKAKKDKTIRIKTSLRKSSNKAILEVIDNGSGFDEESRKKLFEPFYSTKIKGEGMGLGLAIVKMFVDKFDGTIRGKNNKTGGATFRVSFPVIDNSVN